MRSNRLTAAVAVLSLPILSALAALAPANAVWANETPGTLDVRQLPTRSVEQPQAPKSSLDEVKIPELVEAQPEARTLPSLVAQFADTTPADREAECLAAAVYFEAKSEGLDGQLAVAQTILNRTRSGRFPSSICGVVFQPGQFSFVRGNGFPPIVRTSRHWQHAQAIAHIAANDLWDSTVDNALYFHARRVKPGWRMQRIAAVGNHVFYR
ncbi:MAG: cell wall hydrolase [Alphaproteobacteria bacterium]|nr:cell wall hydrolase [Alphaproteobacteria bacterium]